MTRLLFAALVVALVPSALAQPDPPMSTSPSILATLPADLTDAERAVAETIEADGIHVVHFWAPWCDNSIAELRAGWYEAVEQHPEKFAFLSKPYSLGDFQEAVEALAARSKTQR